MACLRTVFCESYEYLRRPKHQLKQYLVQDDVLIVFKGLSPFNPIQATAHPIKMNDFFPSVLHFDLRPDGRPVRQIPPCSASTCRSSRPASPSKTKPSCWCQSHLTQLAGGLCH